MATGSPCPEVFTSPSRLAPHGHFEAAPPAKHNWWVAPDIRWFGHDFKHHFPHRSNVQKNIQPDPWAAGARFIETCTGTGCYVTTHWMRCEVRGQPLESPWGIKSLPALTLVRLLNSTNESLHSHWVMQKGSCCGNLLKIFNQLENSQRQAERCVKERMRHIVQCVSTSQNLGNHFKDKTGWSPRTRLLTHMKRNPGIKVMREEKGVESVECGV